MNWYKLDKKYIISCFLLSILSLIYVFPVILMNLYFKDDMGVVFCRKYRFEG